MDRFLDKYMDKLCTVYTLWQVYKWKILKGNKCIVLYILEPFISTDYKVKALGVRLHAFNIRYVKKHYHYIKSLKYEF